MPFTFFFLFLGNKMVPYAVDVRKEGGGIHNNRGVSA